MCRLALFNRQWLEQVSLDELSGLFTTLDAKQGGHGVGIALCYEKNEPVIYKGINLEPCDLAAIVHGEKDNPDLQYILFHARMMSSGALSDDMCHPFTEGTRYGLTMAHNGVIHSLSGSDTFSDTRILYDLLTVYKMPMSILKDLSGVFIGVYKRMPFVVKASNYSDLSLCYTPDYSAWCFASSFYEYTAIFRKRFCMESKLNTFSWAKKLNAKIINGMYTTQDYYTSYAKNYAQKPLNWSETATKPIAGYGALKKRTIGKYTTYHEQACTDWYCEGECVDVSEDMRDTRPAWKKVDNVD